MLISALLLPMLSLADAAFQSAGQENPIDAQGYNKLGNALREKQRLDEAITAYRKAIELDPKYAHPHYNLGITLLSQKRLDEAIASLRKAIQLEPKFGEAHGALGRALLKRGMFTEAATVTEKALDLLPPEHPARSGIDEQVRRCRQLVALDEELGRVLSGKEEGDGTAFIALARLCRQYKQQYATATKLFRRGFDSKPDGKGLAQMHRYDAACAAALAGAGKGEEASKLADEDKTKLRAQARDWLGAELNAVGASAKAAQSRPVLELIARLERWLTEPELTGVRDPRDLAKMAADERAQFEKLWADIRALLKDGNGRFRETKLEGELSAKENHQVHKVKLSAGKSYVIDLESKAFDALLILEDPQGKKLADNDDRAPDDQNARILFTSKEDGTYRVVATSFEQKSSGPYQLRIREFIRDHAK
ncbi:MAG: tetratricopeptide repeat protein [Planctomycetes bacterium]|nr:tetratricopeptide repeat protein [Planctomycetota bacterium]